MTPPASSPEEKPQGFSLVIEAGRTEGHYWRDVWRYRELLFFLSWRDMLVRYKQTVLGVAWSVIRPVLTTIVFTFIFGRIARLPSEGIPYPLLVLAGMLPWQFFANSLTESSNSLITNANLVSKVYFPRFIMPASAVAVCFVDFLINAVLLAGLMAWYRSMPSWQIVALPLFLLLTIAASMGAGLWLAALNVKYRDFRYVVPFIVQFGLYVSPVGFTSNVIPEKWRLLYSLNPMVGVIDGFRWAIFETALYLPGLMVSATTAVVMLGSGIWFFRRTERSFADTI
jgi:lipopolysaccharide transport system permease protein